MLDFGHRTLNTLSSRCSFLLSSQLEISSFLSFPSTQLTQGIEVQEARGHLHQRNLESNVQQPCS